MGQNPSWKLVALIAVIGVSFSIPIFRSGGRTHLTFWQWVWNHTVFGPPVEYVPEEDYTRELEGVERPKLLISGSQVEMAKAHYQISEPSARELLGHQGICEPGIATWEKGEDTGMLV